VAGTLEWILARYDKIAEAMGWYGVRIENPENLPAALERAESSDRPALLDVVVPQEIT